jgi:signal transduction histidine kinase
MRSRRRDPAAVRLSVRTALMAIVAVALGPVLALAWLSGEEDRRRAAKAALNRSYGVVDRVASEQSELIDSSAVLMTTLAELPLFTRGRARCERVVKRALDAAHRSANVIVLDGARRVICSARPVSRRINFGDVIPARGAARTAQRLGPYTVDPITRQPIMITALPVRRANGSLEGALVVPLDMRWLYRAAPTFGLPREGRLRVVDARGRTLVESPPDPALAVGRSIGSEATRELTRNARGSFTATGPDGVERLTVFRRLPSAPGARVSAVAEIPTDEVYAEAERVRRRNLIGIAIALLGAVLAAALAARVLVLRPIRRLAEAARRLGSGDLSARAGSGYAGELEQLAVAMDQSAAALERRERERSQNEVDLRHLAEQRTLLIAEALAAEDRTRAQLSEALHDDALQVLLAARHELADAATGDEEALLRTRDYLDQASRRLRVLTNDLAPDLLAYTTLAGGIENLARLQAELNNWDLRLDVDPEVASDHDRLLMRAGRELLVNVAKHTQARTVSIELRECRGSVELVVRDDGSGFDPDLAGAVRSGHIGLASLSARAEAAGGDFTIESGAGRGSTVTVRVPSRAVG